MSAVPPAPNVSRTPEAIGRFWRRLTRQQVTDRSLTVLTSILLAEVVLLPPLIEMGLLDRHLADAVFVAGLALGVWMLADQTLPGRLFLATAFATALVRLGNLWLPEAHVRVVDAALAAGNLAVLCWLTLVYTLSDGRITVHRVLGAIAAFLLIGLTFVQLHRLVAMHFDGAYLLLGQPVAYRELLVRLGYYSFVTLTSLGYGDITPVHPLARALAVLQALIGVLYPVALLGWLVAQVGARSPEDG